MADRRAPAVLRSFNYAFEGVIHVLRTQRNMRIHFAIAAAVLVLAFIYDVTRLELIALMISIAFVLIAEMVNTAVEATIDLSTPSFDPLAKIAKDIAAGAVLIAAANAVAVGYLVLADRLARPSTRLVNSLGDSVCRPAYRERIREHFASREAELCGDCKERNHNARELIYENTPHGARFNFLNCIATVEKLTLAHL